MAWYDILNSHDDVSKELAEHVVLQWDMEHQVITSPQQWEEAVDLTADHLKRKHDKSLIVHFLDAFVRG